MSADQIAKILEIEEQAIRLLDNYFYLGIKAVDANAAREILHQAILSALQAIRGQPVAWHTDDYLTDKSATTYEAEVAERWRLKGWPVEPLFSLPLTVQEK